MVIAANALRTFLDRKILCSAADQQEPPLDIAKCQPRVDVFITYCGEGIDILLDTIRAVYAQTYTKSSFRIVILDDSSNPAVENAVSTFKPSWSAPTSHGTTADSQSIMNQPQLCYATRNYQPTTHCKAGNLNFGLAFSSSLPGGAAPFIAVLDVDMIPVPHWLDTVVSHIAPYPSVGIASPWQFFYNTPPSDPLGWGRDLASWVTMFRLSNPQGRVPGSGTGFVIRRAALEGEHGIGGFPQESVSEDLLTTCLLGWENRKTYSSQPIRHQSEAECEKTEWREGGDMGKQWKRWETVAVPGQLQWGLCTDTMADLLRQRPRWTAGFVSIVTYLLCPPQTKQDHIPYANGKGHKRERTVPHFFQRLEISFCMGILEITASIGWTVAMFLFPVLLATGTPLLPQRFHQNTSSKHGLLSSRHQVTKIDHTHNLLLLRLSALDFTFLTLFHILTSNLLDGSVPLCHGPMAGTWNAPYRLHLLCRIYIFPILQRVHRPIIALFTRANGQTTSPLFTPTGLSSSLGLQERERRKHGRNIFYIVVVGCGAWMHLLSLSGLFYGAFVHVHPLLSASSTGSMTPFAVLPTMWVLWVTLVVNAWTPIAYALWPPPLKEREAFLKRDERGVAYPREEVRVEMMKRPGERVWLVLSLGIVGWVWAEWGGWRG